MEIQCECGKFRAELKAFPRNTPGRLVCYCDDCQSYLHYLKRGDLLDQNGGTEIIPAYPADVKIVSGKEHLRCVQLSPKGMLRFSTSCCNTPVGNARMKSPWIGIQRSVYKNPMSLGPVRARIMGRFAKGVPPKGTPQRLNLGSFLTVLPFILKGKIHRKSKPSPFFSQDGLTPIVSSHVLTLEERQAARALAGVSQS